MPIKVTVTGKPNNIRQIKHENQNIICLDFEEGGSPASPKGLPCASKVSITALLNSKQWKNLLKSIEQAGDTLTNAHKLLIQGEITLDMPLNIVEGEIGLVCFQVQYLPKKEKEGPNFAEDKEESEQAKQAEKLNQRMSK